MPVPRLPLLAALAGCLLLALTPLRAGEGGFSATLSFEEKTASGLGRLTPAELAVLDRVVADEVALARQQYMTEFSENFVARRSPEERQQAGLDRLTLEQQARLNELVATALASRPKPKERPRLKDSDILATPKPAEVHGSVTLSYGWSGGRSIRGESLWFDYYDPETRMGIGVGISNYSGNGFGGYCPDGPASGYYYGGSPFLLNTAARDDSRADFTATQGGYSFCPSASGDMIHGFRRH